MNRYLKILTILIIASLFALYRCVGGIDLDLIMGGEEQEQEEEEVTSSPVLLLEDPAGVSLLTTGSKGVDPTSFAIAFREPVDICDGCIALTCDDLPFGLDQPTITVEQTDEEGKEYEISVEDAYLYQLKVCTVTISGEVFGSSVPLNVATSASKALGEDVSFTFECGCAVSDDFNADSHSCYTAVDSFSSGYGDETTWSYWEWILDEEVISFNTDAGILIYDDTIYEDNAYYDVAINHRRVGFAKTIEISEEGFDLTIHFRSASNLSATVGDTQDHAMVIISGPSAYLLYGVGILNFFEEQYCVAMCGDVSDDAAPSYIMGTPCDSGEHYVRLTYNVNSVTGEHSTDGDEWSTLERIYTNGPESMPIIENMSGSGRLEFVFGAVEVTAENPRDNRAIIDSVITTGVTGTGGQY